MQQKNKNELQTRKQKLANKIPRAWTFKRNTESYPN